MNNVRERSPIIFNSEFNSDSSDVEDIENIINIAMANVSQIEMNMAKDMLPEYSGGSKNLAYFIKQVEMYIELLRKPEENCIFNRLLFEQVKSKLTGEARDVLISSNCNRWSELKEELLQRFGDPRSEELLAHDLNTCFQTHNQSYEQYYEIIKHKLQILLEHISIRTPNRDIRISKENMYVQQALSTFKAGILEPYCSHLLNIPINSLEQALYECRKYDNEKAQITFMNFMRHKTKPNNLHKKPLITQNHRLQQTQPTFNKTYSPLSNNFALNQPYSNPHHNTARSAINTQARPTPNFNNNSNQNLGQNSHIRRNSFSVQNKPTPMSISTRNTFRPPQSNNYFRQQSRPTFISEELFNIEQNSENITDFDHPPYDIPMQNNHLPENIQPSMSHSQNFNNCFDDNSENFPQDASEMSST